MLNILQKLKDNAWLLRSLPQTIYFNFRYLPCRQAVKLPIWLYKPKFKRLKGSVSINAQFLRHGMIQLGKNRVSVYPNNGISLDIDGDIVFNGTCYIGNDSFLSLDKGKVIFGNNFNATAAVKIISKVGIDFGENVLIGWSNLICDSDFHFIYETADKKTYPHEAKITIGNHVWIANGCSIMKGSYIPNNTIVAAKSLVNKKLVIPEYSLIAGCPAVLKKNNVIWQI